MLEVKSTDSFMSVIHPYILKEARAAAEKVIADKVQAYKTELENAVMEQMKDVSAVIVQALKDPDLHVVFEWKRNP